MATQRGSVCNNRRDAEKFPAKWSVTPSMHVAVMRKNVRDEITVTVGSWSAIFTPPGDTSDTCVVHVCIGCDTVEPNSHKETCEIVRSIDFI